MPTCPRSWAVSTSYLGRGVVTSTSAARAVEGTTFEASCYADPLGVEHLTGSLRGSGQVLRRLGGARCSAASPSKFGDVEQLLGLAHNGRVRVRMSVNAPVLIRQEGGTILAGSTGCTASSDSQGAATSSG